VIVLNDIKNYKEFSPCFESYIALSRILYDPFILFHKKSYLWTFPVRYKKWAFLVSKSGPFCTPIKWAFLELGLSDPVPKIIHSYKFSGISVIYMYMVSKKWNNHAHLTNKSRNLYKW